MGSDRAEGKRHELGTGSSGILISRPATLVAVIMIAVGISQDSANRQARHDKFAGGTRVLKVGG